MNIYILNASNMYNYGSMMMAENFIYYSSKLSSGENTYYVETDAPEDTVSRLRAATGNDNIQAVKPNSLFKAGKPSKSQLLASFLMHRDIISDVADKLDLLIVLGGDDYTEDYGWRSLISQLLKVNALTGKLKVIFLGQTMGPFYSFRQPLSAALLKKAQEICIRDDITYKYLAGLGLKNLSKIPDLALMPLAKEQDSRGVKDRICFFPSELIYKYSRTPIRELCLDFYLKAVKHIALNYPDKKIVLIPHVLKPESSNDSKMTDDIYSMLAHELGERLVKPEYPALPYEVRAHIKKSEFVVSARMHPIISALECKVPGICFSYSRKYWGIIGEGYGLGDLILDVREKDFATMLDDFIMTLKWLSSNNTEVEKRIAEKVSGDQLQITDGLSRILKM